MALISCPECKQQISDSSAACIHCGHSCKKSGSGCENTAIGCVVFVIIMFFVLRTLGNMPEDRRSSRGAPKEVVFNSSYDSSVDQVRRWLKSNARDPDSLQFIEWSPVQKVESGFVVRVKYRAKNGFGGYAVENKLFGMDLKGNVLGCKDFEQ